MSICTDESMTNHHAPSLWAQLSDTLHLWNQRWRSRQELSQWSARDLNDLGLSTSDLAREAEKPFWRA